MKIALCQMENKGSVQENLEGSLRAVREAAPQHTDLILFPEVQLTEFFPQYPGKDVSRYRVRIDSEIVKAFCDVAREHQIMVVPNLYLEEHGKAYDASLLIQEDGTVTGVQKMGTWAQADKFLSRIIIHLPMMDLRWPHDGIWEDRSAICFDRHYPESIRTEALMGADLILIPTVNTKAEPSEMFEWELRVQAFHNSVFIAMCNRVGMEGEMDFSGESIIVDANEILFEVAD